MLLRTSENIFKFNFALVKFSGYIFYSVKKVGKKLTFKRSFFDVIWLCFSFAFSSVVYSKAQTRNFNENLRSTNLSQGVGVLYRLFILSLFFTKCFNFLVQTRSFEIVKDFYWILEEVKIFLNSFSVS